MQRLRRQRTRGKTLRLTQVLFVATVQPHRQQHGVAVANDPERIYIMTNEHAKSLREATASLLKATLAYARTDDQKHYHQMVMWQNRIWVLAKQVAEDEATELAD